MNANACRIFLLLIFSAIFSGCATLHDPADLAIPKRPTHFVLDQPLIEHKVMGLLNIKHEIGFLPGRYHAERDDGQGTYFRGPAGAIYVHTEGVEFAQYHSGGFWMPHDPALKPHFYTYEGSMRTARPMPDEALRRTSVAEGALGGAVGGALGGAAGGVAAHAVNPKFGNSYGQAGMTGAGAGLVAGAIIGAVIAMDSGKINLGYEIADPAMAAYLRTLTQQAVPISQAPVLTSAVAAPPVPEAKALPPAHASAVVPANERVPKPEPGASASVPQAKAVEALPEATTSTRAPAKKRIGPHSYNAEQYALAQGCKPAAGAWLISEPQAGSGRYFVECRQGGSLALNCDAYACLRAED